MNPLFSIENTGLVIRRYPMVTSQGEQQATADMLCSATCSTGSGSGATLARLSQIGDGMKMLC